MMPPALRATGLSVGFQDGRGGMAAVLDVARVELAAGARAAITGPSGSGKSTLLQVLSGLISSAAGAVDWGGTDIQRLTPSRRDAWRRRMLGQVFQDFHLIPELTPLANVLLPVSFGHMRTPPALRARAEALLARLGVPEGARATATLSRGEQQRVAIARALILDPPVIFADEPTANLDGAAAEVVADLLLALNAEEGRSLLVVTHDPGLIARIGPVIALERGRLRVAA